MSQAFQSRRNVCFSTFSALAGLEYLLPPLGSAMSFLVYLREEGKREKAGEEG